MAPAWQDRDVNQLHLILGDEEFLIDRAVSAIIREVRATMQGNPEELPVTRLRAGDVTPSEIIELLSPSLFAEDRVVVLESAGEAGKEAAAAIEQAVKEPAPGIVLVVIHSGGGRAKNLVSVLKNVGAEATECPRVTKFSEREDFVINEFRTLGVQPSRDTVHALLDAIGGDLRELASAVSQLVADTGGRVDPAAVRRYYAGVAGVTGFQVADSALVGDTAAALAALRWALIGGLHPVPIADALADSLLSMAQLSTSGRSDPFSLAKTLGMPPWKIKKIQQQLRIWDRPRLAQAMNIATELNGAVKGQAADAEYALEKAVREISQLAVKR